MGRVHFHLAQSRTQLRDKVDVGADETLNQTLHTGDHRIQLQGPRILSLLSAKAQELPGENRSPISGLADLLDVFPPPVVHGRVAQQEIAETANGSQQIIEVVRHAPCEPAGRIHPLDLTQLFLTLVQRGPGSGALADVGGQHQAGPPPVPVHLVGNQLHVHNAAVLPLVLDQSYVAPRDPGSLEAMVNAGSILGGRMSMIVMARNSSRL